MSRPLPHAALAVQRQLRELEAKHRAPSAAPSVYPDLAQSRGHRALQALDDRALQDDHAAARAAHTFAETEPA